MNEGSWDGTEGEVIDSSGNGHDGTAKNGADTIADGKLGRCGQLDGVDDYLDLGDDTKLNLTTALTVEFWVRPHSSQEICYTPETGGNVGIAAKVASNESSANWSWQLRYGSPDSCCLGFQANDSGGSTVWVTAKQFLTSNQWYHIAVTFDAPNLKFYVNGVETDSDVLVGNIASNVNKLLIGSDGWSGVTGYFDGDVDNFRLYDKEL